MFLLACADRMHRLAGQYRAQEAAVRAAGGPRTGIRLTHIVQAAQRAERARDAYHAEAEAALDAGTAPIPPASYPARLLSRPPPIPPASPANHP